MMCSYLTGRGQRVKVNGSSALEKKWSAPQGSVMGPLLFSISFNDIFLFLDETEICNDAVDTKIYCSHQELQEVTLRLENCTTEQRNWFTGNVTKLNEEMSCLLAFGEKDTKNSAKFGPSVIKESDEEKISGVMINQKLTLKKMFIQKAKSKATCSYKGFDVYAQRKNQDCHESL